MTRDKLKVALVGLTSSGAERGKIGGEVWLRQRSGWAKQFAWTQDPNATFSWAELGIANPEKPS